MAVWSVYKKVCSAVTSSYYILGSTTTSKVPKLLVVYSVYSNSLNDCYIYQNLHYIFYSFCIFVLHWVYSAAIKELFSFLGIRTKHRRSALSKLCHYEMVGINQYLMFLMISISQDFRRFIRSQLHFTWGNKVPSKKEWPFTPPPPTHYSFSFQSFCCYFFDACLIC